MSYTKHVVKGSIILFVMGVLIAALGYGIRFLFTRAVSVDEYGLYYAVYAFIFFFSTFRDLGTLNALQKFIPEYEVKKDYRSISSMAIYSVLIICALAFPFFLILFFAAPWLATHYFHDERAASLLFFMLWYFIADAFLTVIRSLFLAFKRTFFSISPGLLVNVCVFLVLFFSPTIGIEHVAQTYALSSTALLIIYALLLIFLYPQLFVLPQFQSTLFKKLILFGLPILFMGMGAGIISMTDSMMLTYFSLEQVGVYNVIMPTALLLLMFGKSIGGILMPVTSEMQAKGMKKQLTANIEKLHHYTIFLILPVGAVLFAYPQFFLTLFFGEAYSIGASALRILIIATTLYNLAIINNIILSGLGHPRITMIAVLSGAFVNVIMNALLIPHFHGEGIAIIGAAIASLCGYVTVLFVSLHQLKKVLELHFPWKKWLHSIVLSLLFLGVLFLLKFILPYSAWITAFLSISIAGVVYLLLAYFTCAISLKEIQSLVQRTPKR